MPTYTRPPSSVDGEAVAPVQAATETTVAALLAKTNDLEADASSLARIATSPPGYDRQQGRNRVTAVLESGTVTTVSTVTAANLTGIGSYQANMLVNNGNLSAWAACHRALIT